MIMARDKSAYVVQSVEHALDILEILAADSGGCTVQHIASQLGVSRNKAFRLVATLEERGLVVRDDLSGTCRLGLAMVEMAQKLINSVSLVRLAHPVMEFLARRHDEAVYLTVLQGDEVLFLDMVDSGQNIKAASLVGRRFPFFTNAAGKALKALESIDVVEKFFRRHRKKECRVDLEALEHELESIRLKGVAIDIGGLGEGVVGVAVAVRDYAGKVVAAITMLGPSFRMLTDRLEDEIVPSLLEGAEMLSMKFGYARA
jgi:DNA-binding IclR family transcriptional regulator